MAYTEETGNAASYSAINPSESIWDEGNSRWDFNGNVYVSQWDTNGQDYTEQTGNTVIWTEQ